MEKGEMHCGHGRVKMGILIVLFGLVFLLGALDVLTSKQVAVLWPIVVILAGLTKMMKGCGCGHCSTKK